jgi:hypothetical protein
MTIATIADGETVENERSRTTETNTNDHEQTFRDSFVLFFNADDIVDVEATDKHEDNSKNMRVRRDRERLTLLQLNN